MENSDLVSLREDNERETCGEKQFKIRLVHLFWLLVPLLLWWSLRLSPFADIGRSLARLRAWQIGVLLLINIVIFVLFGLRWWIVVRSLGQRLGLGVVTLFRLAGFALNYFTPGPQVGGEPLMVLLLVRRGMPAPQAISSVFLDKLLELLATFTFLVIGLTILLTSNLADGWVKIWMWPLVVGVLAFPAAHLFALWHGRLPLTWLFARLTGIGRDAGWLSRAGKLVRQAEDQIARLIREQPRMLLGTIALSGFTWVVLMIEYLATLRFLGLGLTLAQSIVALTLARISFLIPLPGGLGALEASQVLAMQVLGFNPALGITLSLVMRARDIFSGGIGLLVGGWAARH